MHAYAAFLQAQMDANGWTQSDFARAAGVERQVVNAQLKDRPSLVQRPDQKTVESLARALRISPDILLAKIAEAMGLPAKVHVQVTVVDIDQASDEELLLELTNRLNRGSRAYKKLESAAADADKGSHAPPPAGNTAAVRSGRAAHGPSQADATPSTDTTAPHSN